MVDDGTGVEVEVVTGLMVVAAIGATVVVAATTAAPDAACLRPFSISRRSITDQNRCVTHDDGIGSDGGCRGGRSSVVVARITKVQLRSDLSPMGNGGSSVLATMAREDEVYSH